MRKAAGFDDAVLSAIAAGAAAAYPNEGCGALLGPRPGPDGRRVTLTVPVPNTEAGTPRVRFEVAPRDYLAVEDEADRRGLALLGFWHSHPDCPANPSATDRAYAWVGLLTVIVSVQKGEPGSIGAWEIRGPEEPFATIEIVASEKAETVTTLAGKAATQGDPHVR